MTYSMNTQYIPCLMDQDIVKDVLEGMKEIINQCELHKITKRRAVNQAAYAVVKLFGHRSAFHDLQLTHPSMQHDLFANAEIIPVPGITAVEVYWRLVLLGKESKKGSTGTSMSPDDRLSGNTAMANQVEVDVRRNFNRIVVSMEMTGPAFFNLAKDCGKRGLADTVREMLKAKWGSTGTAYGLYQPANSKESNEGYRFVRLIDGVPKVYARGWEGWVGV